MKKLFFVLFILFINANTFSQTAVAPSGSGTAEDPYLIATLNNLYWITQNSGSWTSHFKQTADIDASSTTTWDGGAGFYPIGKSPSFRGTYDGDGHTITGLYISRSTTDYVGLFGTIQNATIKNIGLINVNITGRYDVGGISGSMIGIAGAMYNCFTTGSISGSGLSGIMGGLVGGNNDGSISNCYSTASVSSNFAGGLVYSISNATISNCYSTGYINGTGGGLIGSNTNSTVENSFWDTETSGKGTSPGGGTAKTTAEMKESSTFLNAEWSTSIWNMDSEINNGYPYLSWQNPGGTPLPVELTAFAADIINGEVTLNWQTATEVNNYGFEIQKTAIPASGTAFTGLSAGAVRNSAGDGWVKIGFVNGHGNSNSPKNYSFVENNVQPGEYSYRLKQIDFDGAFEYSETVGISFMKFYEFELEQNYPNPFNPVTTIKFTIPDVGKRHAAHLQVYDILGREAARLVNEKITPGKYEIEFDGSNLSSGIYYYTFSAGSYRETKKMLLLK